jgi:hypothetical protein
MMSTDPSGLYRPPSFENLSINEKIYLKSLRARYGNQWKAISRHFPGRSVTLIKSCCLKMDKEAQALRPLKPPVVSRARVSLKTTHPQTFSKVDPKDPFTWPLQPVPRVVKTPSSKVRFVSGLDILAAAGVWSLSPTTKLSI